MHASLRGQRVLDGQKRASEALQEVVLYIEEV